MRISLIQMRVTGDKTADLENAARLVSSAGKNDLIMLPEMFCCEYRPQAFVENAEPVGGASRRRSRIWLMPPEHTS